MAQDQQSRRSPEIIVRVLADVVIVNLAMLAGIVASYVWDFGVRNFGQVPDVSLGLYIQSFGSSFAAITVICISVFYFYGFYTRGRSFASRPKALNVMRAACTSFLVFAGLVFFFAPSQSIPRDAVIVAWIVATCILVIGRLWAKFWLVFTKGDGATQLRYINSDHPKSVLVIGGAGYIGSALLPKLLDSGYHVRLLDKFIYGDEPIKAYRNNPKLEILEGDFRQIDRIVEAMHGMDAVIHLGAIVGDPACAINEDLTVEVNLVATRLIAEIAKGHGINRFIFASTCSVYGASDEILDERSDLKPVSLYAKSKIAAEKVLMQMADANFSPTMLRFGTIYGLSGRTRFDLVVNLLSAKSVIDGEITVFGSDQWRPFLHVDDAAEAVFLCLKAPVEKVKSEVFNVGSDEQNATLGEIGDLINKMVPTAKLISSASDGDRRNYRVDFSKIRTVLGFKPHWTLESGVQQVLDAIRESRVKDYKEPKYSNVKYFLEEGGSDLLRVENGWASELIKESVAAAKVVERN